MDFIERLNDAINTMVKPPIVCRMGYLGTGESLVIYPLPGGRVTQEYMDGTKDQELNYEIAMKSKSHQKIGETLWTIQSELEKLDALKSNDGSFEFEELIITNKPFINQLNDQNWFVFLLNIQAKITVYREE